MMAGRLASQRPSLTPAQPRGPRQVLSGQARLILSDVDVPDLADVACDPLGDELSWAWQMNVDSQDASLRTEFGWRRACVVLNLLVWADSDQRDAARVLAHELDAALAA
jgi:hypothetical protein